MPQGFSLSLVAAVLLSSTALAQQGQRADLCAELAAFVSKDQGQKPADTAPAPSAAVAVQAPARSPEDRPKPGGGDIAQQSSGISGPVTAGGPGAQGPQGQAQETSQSGQANPRAGGGQQAATQPTQPPQAQGQPPQPQSTQPAQPAPQPRAAAPAPAAPTTPVAPPPSPEALQAAQAAIDGKDVSACRDAAQKMRRAGVALPAPLLALAAVNPDLLKQSGGETGAPQGAGPQ